MNPFSRGRKWRHKASKDARLRRALALYEGRAVTCVGAELCRRPFRNFPWSFGQSGLRWPRGSSGLSIPLVAQKGIQRVDQLTNPIGLLDVHGL
jgi:hypothetical protein